MRSGKIAIAATVVACTTLLPIVGAQAAKHPRHMMHAHRYGPNPVAAGADIAGGAVDTAGMLAFGAIGTATAIAAAPFGGGPYAYDAGPGWGGGGYYAPSGYGDFECRPGYPGCRPYAAKDWSYR